MTVIAFDGRTMAADRAFTVGGTMGKTRKIFLINGCLVGLSGNVAAAKETIYWFKAGADPETYPGINKTDDCCALLVVRPDMSVWRYEATGYPFQVRGRYASAGCGAEGAMVAMMLKASAKEAVKMVNRVNNNCGGGVDTLTFNDKEDPENA